MDDYNDKSIANASFLGMRVLVMTDDSDTLSVPITEEVLTVDKHVEDGRQVRVRTVVEDRQEVVQETVQRGVINVERVAIGRFVDTAPTVREEGDVMIVPVIEERLVVERRLFLIEEVRLHRLVETKSVEIPETRRVMRAVVEDVSADQQQQGN